MIPGASLFLYLLPLAAAPVVFHLLMRRQRKTLVFSTKMFFDRVRPQLTFYQRFRELLLLAARTGMIALLLLALARLLVPGLGDLLGLRGNQAMVVVLDNSGSMTGKLEGGNRRKMDVAVEGARALLSHMDKKGRAALVLLVDDPRAGRAGGMTADKDSLLDYLETLEGTEATGNPARAIQRALALLKEAAPAGGGSVHVFTDLQETEWKQPAVGPGDVADRAQVYFHRIPTAAADKPNVCVVSAKTSARRILPNQPYQVELTLRNGGERPAEIRVNRKTSEQSVPEASTVVIAAGQQKMVQLPFRPKAPGRHWMQIWIEGDGFEGDNRAFVSWLCEAQGEIYFVGERVSGDFGLLPLAFSPRGDGRFSSLVPSYMTLQSLPDRMERKKPVLVVLKWSDACALAGDAGGRLEQFIRQGGNLLVLPAVAGSPPAGTPPAWLAAAPEKIEEIEQGAPLSVSGDDSEFWAVLRGLDGRVRFGKARASKFHPLSLREDAGYVPLLRSSNGRPVLAVRSLGKGQITVSGIALGGGEKQWSNLPTLRTFLVLTQSIALGAVSGLANENTSLVAGNAPTALPGKADDVKITTVLGDRVDWSGPRDQTPALVRAGAYILSTGKRETCLSVMPSDREGDTVFLDGTRVAAMGDAPHAVRTLSEEQELRDEIEDSAAGMSLFLPLLLAAVATLMVEGWLGSPPRPRKWQPAAGEEQRSWDELPGESPANFDKAEVA